MYGTQTISLLKLHAIIFAVNIEVKTFHFISTCVPTGVFIYNAFKALQSFIITDSCPHPCSQSVCLPICLTVYRLSVTLSPSRSVFKN